MAVLREHFPERLISIRGDLEWPARFPDLVPCDFFSMGFFKIPCLCEPPKDPTRFKDQHPGRNCQHNAIMANTRNLFTQCVENMGRHLPDLISKTK